MKTQDEVEIFQNIVHNFFINKISSMIMIEKHGLNLHYNVIVAKFVPNKSPATDWCPFIESRWILVEEINFE